MPFFIVRQKVPDFKHWKKVFDSVLYLRKASGERSYKIFRQPEELNEVVIFFEWDDVRNAVKYFQNRLFTDALKKAGILTKPVLYLPQEGFEL
ncbi:MAG: hypothetical protein HZA28_08020 [Candidatus Omnitrophica bacterium]|nr:hypothetical protein [Candidatus Omnitrophota bacterium]